MPTPRQSLISLDSTPYYHCVSRCVRRAFLCGEDTFSGRSFEHRRGWIEARVLELSRIFALDVCAYAVMSNHTHVVLYVDQAQANAWTLEEVLTRWHSLFAGIELSQRYLAGDRLTPAELCKLQAVAESWRERLASISWFMRCLNEPIARMANAEDGCTGRFWEGRFKSQALLDESALAACLAYVDLNPVRAGMAETPEGSDYTSAQRRIHHLKAMAGPPDGEKTPAQPCELAPFVGNPRQAMPKGLPFNLLDYLELLEWTGRQIRDDKPGRIPAEMPPILRRLNIKPAAWLQLTTQFETAFCQWIGHPESIHEACARLGQKWAKGASACKAAFSP